MKAFWRENPLTNDEQELLALVFEAHANSAFRNNVSSAVLLSCFAGSSDFSKSVAGALMSLGEAHGPIEKAMHVLVFRTESEILANGNKVPGWGSSFVKGEHDQIWAKVDDCLEHNFPTVHVRICDVTETLQHAGKKLFPNAACYSAAAATIMEIPSRISAWLFIAGRITAWAELAFRQGGKPA